MSNFFSEYDFPKIPQNACVAICGKRMSGKTILLKHLIHKMGRKCIFSAPESCCADLSHCSTYMTFPEIQAWCKINGSKPKNKQEQCTVALDDCIKPDPVIMRDLIRNRESYGISILFTVQYFKEVRPEWREFMDISIGLQSVRIKRGDVNGMNQDLTMQLYNNAVLWVTLTSSRIQTGTASFCIVENPVDKAEQTPEQKRPRESDEVEQESKQAKKQRREPKKRPRESDEVEQESKQAKKQRREPKKRQRATSAPPTRSRKKKKSK